MARLTFPSDRLVYQESAYQGSVFTSGVGLVATVYSDAGGTTLADVQNFDGSANAAATFTVDSTSRLPLWLGPASGADTLYVKVGTGPVTAVYAVTSGDISAAVGTEVANRAAADSAHVAASDPHGDRAAAAADATTKANSAQAAAIAASAQRASNLSDLASATTARTNLGLGTAATQASSAFDASGAAATAQTAAQSFATSAIATQHTADNASYLAVPLVASGGDDTTAATALLPDLRLGVGAYSLPNGMAVGAASIIEGRGMGTVTGAYTTFQDGLTSVGVTSATANGLSFSTPGSSVYRLALTYKGGSTPTAGAGLLLTGADGFRARDVSVKGFYDCVSVQADHYVIDAVNVVDPVRYGFLITGTDSGEGRLVNAMADAGPDRNATAALFWRGGGGFEALGFKCNSIRVGGVPKTWVNGMDFTNLSAATSEIMLTNCKTDSCTGVGVNFDGTTFALSGVVATGTHVRDSFDTAVSAVKARNVNRLQWIGGIVEGGTSTTTLFDIDTVNQLNIDGVMVTKCPANVPMVSLGSSVRSATVRLGNVGPPGVSGANTWPTGTPAYLLFVNQPAGPQYGGQGSFEFAWHAPTITSNSVYTSVWQVANLGPALIEFTMFANLGGTPRDVVAKQVRFSVNQGGTNALTTLAGSADSASSANDIDVQWAVVGHVITIGVKINAASALTSLGSGAHSILKVNGVPKQIFAFN